MSVDLSTGHHDASAVDRLAPSAGVHINDSHLRAPQKEAYAAAREHFSRTQEPAIIQMPVGCGKSGLAGLLALGLSDTRTLIVTPNTTIRRGIAEELDPGSPSSFWAKTGVLGDETLSPRITVIDGPRVTMDDCAASDVVIANIQQLTSSSKMWIYGFTQDFFDLVIFDEGHHSAADSWQLIATAFPSSRFISLTATPFRTDGKDLLGDVIYEYSFSRAMVHGYIKQISSASAQPSQITFTDFLGTRTYSLGQVLVLREEAWFRRGIAMSHESSRHIAAKAAEKLRELREATGLGHQIIASAMSIVHACEVREVFRGLALRAEVIHSGLSFDAREAVLSDLRDGEIDVIVQVGMLGEGFDHPPLSVAAIFRPYRSLSPYIQFVGRVMRSLNRRNPYGPANHAYVVSHAGLNNEAQWDDFGHLDADDQGLVRDLIHGKGYDPRQECEPDGSGVVDGEVYGPIAGDESLSHFVTETFLDPTDDAVIEEMLDADLPGGFTYRGLGVTADQLRRKLVLHRRRYEQPAAGE